MDEGGYLLLAGTVEEIAKRANPAAFESFEVDDQIFGQLVQFHFFLRQLMFLALVAEPFVSFF